jgi:hypothetical protein
LALIESAAAAGAAVLEFRRMGSDEKPTMIPISIVSTTIFIVRPLAPVLPSETS